ncbi:hypothetical protein BGW38_005831, partial [Lunasporangiospora selenospora]
GVYQIALGSLVLTDSEQRPGGVVGVLNPDPREREKQLWHVSHHKNDNEVVIYNEKTGLFLTFEGELYPGQFLVMSEATHSWKMSKADEDRFFIMTEEQYEGENLVFDASPPPIFPPRAYIAWPRKTPDQAWSFRRMDEDYEHPRQYRLPYKKVGLCHY